MIKKDQRTEEKAEEVTTVGAQPQTSLLREIRARSRPRPIGRSKKAGRSTPQMMEQAMMVITNRNSQMVRGHACPEVLVEVEVKMADSSLMSIRLRERKAAWSDLRTPKAQELRLRQRKRKSRSLMLQKKRRRKKRNQLQLTTMIKRRARQNSSLKFR